MGHVDVAGVAVTLPDGRVLLDDSTVRDLLVSVAPPAGAVSG